MAEKKKTRLAILVGVILTSLGITLTQEATEKLLAKLTAMLAKNFIPGIGQILFFIEVAMITKLVIDIVNKMKIEDENRRAKKRYEKRREREREDEKRREREREEEKRRYKKRLFPG